MTKAQQILAGSIDLAAQGWSWIELSNAIMDPEHGLVAAMCPTCEERESLVKTEEWKSVRKLIEAAQIRDRETEAIRLAGLKLREELS